MKRSSLRTIARWLVGVLLFGQLAIAAYACPALHPGAAAAEQGMKDTIPLQAKKGRASYLGERSIGHQDPGATSSYLMLNALLETVKE